MSTQMQTLSVNKPLFTNTETDIQKDSLWIGLWLQLYHKEIFTLHANGEGSLIYTVAVAIVGTGIRALLCVCEWVITFEFLLQNMKPHKILCVNFGQVCGSYILGLLRGPLIIYCEKLCFSVVCGLSNVKCDRFILRGNSVLLYMMNYCDICYVILLLDISFAHTVDVTIFVT